jgi:hypothetical protein
MMYWDVSTNNPTFSQFQQNDKCASKKKKTFRFFSHFHISNEIWILHNCVLPKWKIRISKFSHSHIYNEILNLHNLVLQRSKEKKTLYLRFSQVVFCWLEWQVIPSHLSWQTWAHNCQYSNDPFFKKKTNNNKSGFVLGILRSFFFVL